MSIMSASNFLNILYHGQSKTSILNSHSFNFSNLLVNLQGLSDLFQPTSSEELAL